MYNTAIRILNHTGEAEDVVQEAFTDAFFQLGEFQNKVSFGAWLKQIVVFKCVTLLKKKRRLNTAELTDSTELIDSEPDINEESLELSVDLVRTAILKLPDGYRTIITLYLLEGYDQEEIAEILQISHSTVRTQYIRGKKKLLDLLKNKTI
jgi:RNA polymerase sigma factor (sigma-70 family)